MALTLDTNLRIPATALTTTTSAATANYTCGANAKVLVVMVLYAGVTARTGGAPTYNSVGLTQAETRQGVTEASCELWYLIAPPVSQALSLSVPNDNGRTMWVYVASGNAGVGNTCAYDSSGVNATTNSNPTVSVTTVAAGCLIFAVVATGDNTFAPSARTGTSLYEEDIAAYGGAGQYFVKSNTGAQAMTWTEATSDDYGAIAVAFKEVTAPVSITLSSGAITSAGQALTLSLGAVSTSLSSATASSTGQSLQVVPGAVSIPANSAEIISAGQSITLSLGEATVALLNALLSSQGQTISISSGDTLIQLSSATLSASGQSAAIRGRIIYIGLESDLSEFTSTVTDSGDLSWSNDATAQAVAGTAGAMACLIDDTTSIFGAVTLGTPNTSGTVRFRFYFDPNTLTMTNSNSHYIADLKTTTSSGNDICEVAFAKVDTEYKLAVSMYLDDSGTDTTNFYAISDAPHYIEVLLQRATNSTSNDGYLTFWIDGVEKQTLSGRDNYDRFVSFGYIKIGATFGLDASTSGTCYLDELIVNDDGSEIGPVSSPVTVELLNGSLVFNGQTISIIPGAITTSLSNANLVSNSQAITLIPGEIPITLSNAIINSSGQSLTVSVGEFILSLLSATISSLGQSITIDPGIGDTTISLSSGTLSALGQLLSILAVTNITLNASSLSANGQSIVIQPGDFALALNSATVFSTGQALDIIPGTTSIILNSATTNVNGQAITISLGGAPITINLNAPSVSASGQTLTVSPGEISIALQNALTTLLGQSITISVGESIVPLLAGDIILNGQPVSISTGEISIPLGSALAVLSGQQTSISLGGSTISLSPANLVTEGQSASLLLGEAIVQLFSAILTGTGQQLTVVAEGGPITVNLDNASLSVLGQALLVSPGPISITTNVAILQAGGQGIEVIPGTATITLDSASLESLGQSITTLPGNTNIALNTSNISTLGQTIDITAELPGTTISLDNALLLSSGQALSIIPGDATVELMVASLLAQGRPIVLLQTSSIISAIGIMMAKRGTGIAMTTHENSDGIVMTNRNIDIE